MQNRRPPQISRLERVADCGIIAPRRTSSAHLHRPWRATVRQSSLWQILSVHLRDVEDGTWGLVRASSNKPELVVVVESPVSEARMRDMFKSVDAVLRTHPEVGAYNQTI